jgi:O-antigen/teichoic acid export membrane protein
VPNLMVTMRYLRPVLRIEHLRSALVYCLPLIPHGIGAWVLEVSDRIVLERHVSLDELGIYALGYQLSTMLYLVAAAVNNATSPHVFEHLLGGNSTSHRHLRVITSYYISFIVWAALAFLLLLEPLVHWFVAPAYHAVTGILPWLVLGMLCHALYFMPANVLFATRQTAGIAKITILAGAANLAANLALIPRFGMAAAAWSTLFGYALLLGLVWRKSAQISAGDYDYPRISKSVVAGLIVYGLSMLVWSHADSMMFGVGLLLVVCYPVALYLLRFFPTDELEAIKAWWRSRRVGETG